MATLRHYVSGGFYIRRGYPIRESLSDREIIFTTISVLPRGERFFEMAGYRDGTKLPKSVFYSLLLDGDLDSPSIQRSPPTIRNIPSDVIFLAEGLANSDTTISLLKSDFVSARYLFEFQDALRRLLPENANPEVAGYLCIARHARQAAYIESSS